MRRFSPLLVILPLLTSAAGGGSEPRGLRAEVAALLLRGVAGGSLPIAAALYPTSADTAGEAGRLAFLVELPPAPPVEAEGMRPLEVYVYVIDEAGEVVAHGVWTLADWVRTGEGVKVAGSLEIPAGELGELSVRFLAWDPTARRYGLTVRRLAPGVSLAAPRFTDECADWTLVGDEAAELAELSARPVLISGETQRLALETTAVADAWRVRMVRPREGLTVAEEMPARAAGWDQLEFEVPELPPGIYQLSVVGGDEPVRRTLPLETWLVSTLPAPDGGCRRGWGRILQAARDGEPSAGLESAPPAGDRGRQEASGDLGATAGEAVEPELPVVAAAAELQPHRGLRAEVAALLLQGVAGGSLPIAAALFPAAADGAGESMNLAFLIELPAAPPAEAEGERSLEIYVYVVDDGEEVPNHLAWNLSGWSTAGEGVKVTGSLEVPAGDLSVRFLAWDPATRRYGLAVEELASATSLAAPRFADECAGWAVAGTESSELAELSARPVLVSGETRLLSVDADTGGDGWRVRMARQRDGVGTEQETPARPSGPGRLEFVVPDLPPGIYRLSLVGGGEPPLHTVSLEAWLVAELPPAERGCRRSWGRVLRLAREGRMVPDPGSTTPPMPVDDRSSQRLRADYEALLGRLAGSGDLAVAARDLAELEVPVVADDASRARLLFAAELEAARAVAERDPRCLLPLISLHAETYRVHHGAGRFSLATHSRRLAAAISEQAVGLLRAPDERTLVAVTVAGLAHLMESRRASVEAQRLLERALELDEDQEAARLLLAVSYERRGRYADAREQLERLTARNRAHQEARVRLAILLRRQGDRQGAERLLREVVRERPPAWLLSLAYQTLAQLLIRDSRLGEAASELAEARRRLPGDQALGVLQAYARDRAGERREVQRILAELPPGQAAQTPRYRYSEEPAAELGLLHETLRQSVTVRLPLLAVALGAERGGEAGP